MKKQIGFAIALLLGAGVTAQSNAQTGDMQQPQASPGSEVKGSLSSDDKQFIQDAAKANMMEIELARLAQKRAQAPEVKEFASTIIEEHQKAGSELKQLASQLKVNVPRELDPEGRRERSDLSKVKGADFDKQFVSVMVEQHQEVVDKFDSYAPEADNTKLGSWISSTLPTLRAHLSHARELQGQVGTQKDGEQQGVIPQDQGVSPSPGMPSEIPGGQQPSDLPNDSGAMPRE